MFHALPLVGPQMSQRWQFCHPEHGINNHIDKTRLTSCEASRWFQISSHFHTALAKIDIDAEASTLHISLGGRFTLFYFYLNPLKKNWKMCKWKRAYLENLGKPHLLCVFCGNQVCKFCRWKHVLHVNLKWSRWSSQEFQCFSFICIPTCRHVSEQWVHGSHLIVETGRTLPLLLILA